MDVRFISLRAPADPRGSNLSAEPTAMETPSAVYTVDMKIPYRRRQRLYSWTERMPVDTNRAMLHARLPDTMIAVGSDSACEISGPSSRHYYIVVGSDFDVEMAMITLLLGRDIRNDLRAIFADCRTVSFSDLFGSESRTICDERFGAYYDRPLHRLLNFAETGDSTGSLEMRSISAYADTSSEETRSIGDSWIASGDDTSGIYVEAPDE